MKGNEKENRLKVLIQKSGINKPSPDFTATVMQEVMAKEEAAINPALKSLLKQNADLTISPEFTDQVMMKIEAHELKSAQPIISKSAWYIAAAAMMILVLYIGLSEQSTKDSGNLTPYLNIMGQSVTSLFSAVSSISPLYGIVLISIGGLILLDYLLKVKAPDHKKEITNQLSN